MKKGARKFSFFASILAAILVLIHVVNKLIFLISTKKESLYRCNQQYYQWRFGKISYTKKGFGTPIVLIHELSNTGSNYEYKTLERYLSKNHTVFNIDLIGCGQSDKPNITYTNYLYVQMLNDFMKAIVKEKATVIACRRSSAIAVMNSYIDPSLVENLVLINPCDLKNLSKYPTTKHRCIKWCFELPIVGTFLYNIISSHYFIGKKLKTDYFYNAKPFSHYINAFSEAAHASGISSKYVYTSIRCHYTNTNIVHALRNLKIPILVLLGSDYPNREQVEEDYHCVNPSIEFTRIEHTKGMPHIELPEVCCETIEQFL